mgnify:CR=1 FL=1
MWQCFETLATARREQKLAFDDTEFFRKPGDRTIGDDEVLRGEAVAVARPRPRVRPASSAR